MWRAVASQTTLSLRRISTEKLLSKSGRFACYSTDGKPDDDAEPPNIPNSNSVKKSTIRRDVSRYDLRRVSSLRHPSRLVLERATIVRRTHTVKRNPRTVAPLSSSRSMKYVTRSCTRQQSLLVVQTDLNSKDTFINDNDDNDFTVASDVNSKANDVQEESFSPSLVSASTEASSTASNQILSGPRRFSRRLALNRVSPQKQLVKTIISRRRSSKRSLPITRRRLRRPNASSKQQLPSTPSNDTKHNADALPRCRRRAAVSSPSHLTTTTEENKENRHRQFHESNKPTHVITTTASYFKTPLLNSRTVNRPSLIAPSAGSNALDDSLESSHSKLSSIKSPEKLQSERMKKLKSRCIEASSDYMADDVSQISALSPSNCSILNGTDVDPKERLLEVLKQSTIKTWSEVFHASVLDDLVKIGEGVYGEVFQIGGNNGDVIKIFPIEGEENIMDGSRPQMTYQTVFPEVYVSLRLSELAKQSRENRTVGFSQLKCASLVKGKLPQEFVVQWKVYDTFQGSENICLDHLPSSQLWIILEYEYAGIPLEKYCFSSYLETKSVFEQISLSMAAAEAELQFEHRDLHWGNILIHPTRLDKLRYRVNNINYSVWTHGVRATIIDFTVSRLTHSGNTVYVDMSENPDIFDVYDGEYQNEIYRMMRLLNHNEWRSFNPRTNLMWLHYLCDKILHRVRVSARGDVNFEAVYSELVALEVELQKAAQPLALMHSTPASGIRSRSSSSCYAKTKPKSTSTTTTRPASICEKEHMPLYSSTVQFVASNFYFDSCRMSSSGYQC